MSAKLYDLELSGNCYKVRLMCALTGVPLDIIPVDFLAGDHKKPPVSTLNPFCELPVFQDGDVVLRDVRRSSFTSRASGAGRRGCHRIRRHGAGMRMADDGGERDRAWTHDARLHDKFGFALDVDLARTEAARILALMNAHLTARKWLALDRPTIADVACMPYVALAHEGGVSLDGYPSVAAWVERVKTLPGFIGMPAL